MKHLSFCDRVGHGKLCWRGVSLAMAFATSGCVVPPGGYGAPYQTAQAGYGYPQQYAQPGYPPSVYVPTSPPQPAYQPPVYQSPAYPPPSYDTDQYDFIDGVPYAVFGGQQEVVVFENGLGWGFYDPYHRWHRAPDRWREEFERRYPGGRGYAPPAQRAYEAQPGFRQGGVPGGVPGQYPGRAAEPNERQGGNQPPPGRPPEPNVRQGAFQPGGSRPPEPGPRPEAAGRPANEPGGRPPPEPRPEQHVNAPQPQPQRAAPPQQHQGGSIPACGQPGAPRC